jgi:alkylated DNA repair dioxygenase AlkB
MFARLPDQGSLFGGDEVAFDPRFETIERIELDQGAWLDCAPIWLRGDEQLFEALTAGAEWSQPMVEMYDREVLTPRLVARIDPSIHPVIPEIVRVLSDRYRMPLDQVSAGWYRDGNDSVAFHGDRVARDLDEAIVATVSLGGARRFLCKPKDGGPSRALSLGHGDLVVMGGSFQRTWRHGVPKAKHGEPRIALMFRHRYD